MMETGSARERIKTGTWLRGREAQCMSLQNSKTVGSNPIVASKITEEDWKILAEFLQHAKVVHIETKDEEDTEV